jgi:hypothetical protein
LGLLNVVIHEHFFSLPLCYLCYAWTELKDPDAAAAWTDFKAKNGENTANSTLTRKGEWYKLASRGMEGKQCRDTFGCFTIWNAPDKLRN